MKNESEEIFLADAYADRTDMGVATLKRMYLLFLLGFSIMQN